MSYDIDKLKKIDIVDWMNKHGYKQGRGRSGRWRSFYSPFSSESNPSFKVDVGSNRWLDFSAGITRKQSIIDLVMKLESCDFSTAVNILSDNTEINTVVYEPKRNEPGIKIHSVSEIKDDELISYFTQIRKINIDVLKKWCRQLDISFPFGENKEKTYTVVGMENSLHGWEFRSSFIKLASSPKSFTKIKGLNSDTALIIEGFTDWLSYATYYNIGIPSCDVYILNGLGMLNILKPFLESKKILFMLDNDKPADNALLSLEGFNVVDVRTEHYPFNKDFNEFLVDNS